MKQATFQGISVYFSNRCSQTSPEKIVCYNKESAVWRYISIEMTYLGHEFTVHSREVSAI